MTDCKRNARGYRIGGTHHRAKLTDQEVELARRMHEDDGGWTPTTLAEKFEVTPGCMSKLLRYKSRVT